MQQQKFQQMSEQIIGRLDDMGKRVDDLEKNIGDLMQQVETKDDSPNPKKWPPQDSYQPRPHTHRYNLLALQTFLFIDREYTLSKYHVSILAS